jgi:hypothetical protein
MDIKAFAKEHSVKAAVIETAIATAVAELNANTAALETEVKQLREVAANTMPKYGVPIISAVDTDKAYDSRYEAGARNTKAVEVTVPLPNVGLKVKATIYGNLVRKSDGDEIEYRASLPKGTSAISPEDKEDFLGHVERAAFAWPGWGEVERAADARLLGTKPAKKADGTPAAMRPRLVKTVKATSEPVAASA